MLQIMLLTSKVSLPPNSDPTAADVAFEEFEEEWRADEETAEQERVVHNIKVTKA